MFDLSHQAKNNLLCLTTASKVMENRRNIFGLKKLTSCLVSGFGMVPSSDLS